MARHKTLKDDALTDRLLPLLAAEGPERVTFASAAEAAGLAPATLVQRFGTRSGMIEAVLLRAWARLEARTAAVAATAPPGAAGAMSILVALTPDPGAEAGFPDGLLLLREDFRNPALRARGKAWGEALAAALGTRVGGTALGWQMAQVWQGALIWWGFSRTGSARGHVSAALAAWCRTAGLSGAAPPPG